MPFIDSYYHDPLKEKKKTKREIISVSLNKEERLELDILKKRIGIENDSATLKAGLFIAQNVLQNILGDRIGYNLLKMKKSNQRYIKEKKKIGNAKNEQM